MRKALSFLLVALILLIPISILAQSGEIPSPTRDFYVNDFAQVLSPENEQYILEQSLRLNERTEAQVVVVTIDTIGDNPLEYYSLDILREWGIGHKDQDNGVLILLAVEDRKSRIEVGYGLEGALPDGKTGRIQDEYMLPYYEAEDYSTGLLEGYRAILKEVYNEYDIELEPDDLDSLTPQSPPQGFPQEEQSSRDNRFPAIFIIIFFLFDWFLLGGRITRFLLLLFFTGGRGGPRGGGGGFGGGGSGGGGFRGGGGSGGGGGSSRSW